MIDRETRDQAAQFTVPQDYAGTRLDKWLSEIEPAFSRSRFKALIEQGALSRNGTPFTDPSWKVRVGEVFDFTPPPVEPAQPPTNISASSRARHVLLHWSKSSVP